MAKDIDIKEETTPQKRSKQLNLKKILSWLIAPLVIVLVFLFLIPMLGDYDKAFDILGSLSFLSLAIIALLVIVNSIIYVFPYMAALSGLRFKPAFLIRQATFAISNTLPGGGAIGVGLQYAILASYGFGAAAATTAILLTGWLNILATISLPGIAGIGLLAIGELTQDYAFVAAAGISITAFSLSSFFLIFSSKKLAMKFGDGLDIAIIGILRIFRKAPKKSAVDGVMDFRAKSYTTMSQRWRLLISTNYLQQLSQFAVLYVALILISPGSTGVVQVFAAFAFSRLATFIPLTPGGVGTVDAAMIASLVGFGVPGEVAIAATLIWRFVTFVPQLVVGYITIFVWRLKEAAKSPSN
jgi:uncharacterized protein (TIRG00374 family)